MKRFFALFLAVAMLTTCTLQISAKSADEMKSSLTSWLLSNVTVPKTADGQDSVLDWSIVALARGGERVLSREYKKYVKEAVRKNAGSLYLSDSARYAISAGAVGLDASNVGGVDLISKITNADLTLEAFTASIAFALLALDSNSFGTDGDRQKLIDILVDAQRADGGFNTYLEANAEQDFTVSGEIDATGMVLQALAPYKNDDVCAAVIDDALDFIKANKLSTAGYEAYGIESAESASQVLIALSCLGINPLSSDYMSGENDIIDALSAFLNNDGGGRCWDGSSNKMTSYQMLMALTAFERFEKNMTGLFDMSRYGIISTNIMYSAFGAALPKFASFICLVLGFFLG